MEKYFLKACSMLLVIVLLVNMLPMRIFAEEFRASLTDTATTTENTTPEEATTEDAYVVSEITENRTEYSKEFLLSNGLHMATVYADAVHYETENGWEEIDNTLKTNADGTYSNTAGVWDVTFPEQLGADESITIEKDGYTLSFFMAGALSGGGSALSATAQTFATAQSSAAEIQQIDTTAITQAADFPETVPDKLQSQIAYADVYQNTDIIYDLDSNKVKESMILERYDANLQGYSYTLEVGDMIPVLGEDGSVTLYDENRENIVMVMPAPYLIDSSGEHNYDIEVQLAGKGSTYALIYLLPQDWLAAEARAWPVVLDPIIQADLAASNIRDRTVAEKTTYAQDQGTNICGWDADTGIIRSYIKYRELPQITSSDVVIGAEIYMRKEFTSNTITPVEAHKVLGDGSWDSSTLTWTNKPAFDATIEDYAIVDEIDWYVWIVTDIVRGWYSGANTGMMFKASDAVETGGTANFKPFLSSDYGTESSRPTLRIYFRNNNGLEGYWDYTSSGAGRAGTGYVNNYTGNLTWIRDDIGFGGNRMPVAIQHIYNLNDAITPSDTNNSNDSGGNTFGMGIGWRTNFNQLVYQWNVDDSYYVWEDGDGTDHYFEYSSANTYKDEADEELTLTVMTSGTEKYCITDKTGNCSYFDTQGRLTKISNNQATKSNITITYDGTSKRIATITDGVGRVYSFTYNSSNLLTRISYKSSGSAELSYVTFGYSESKLITVTDKDNEVSTYTYDGNLLKTATDIDGYKLTYSYNTVSESWQPYRVMSVAESDGNTPGGSLTFSYAHNQTTITDYNGNVVIYQFNDFGNTISIQDDEGRAQFAQFSRMDKDDTAGKANQLKIASKLQNTVGNLLPHASFETGHYWTSNSSSLTVARSTEEAYLGDYSLKLTSTTTDPVAALRSSYAVAPGETYTFSAYVKSVDAGGLIALYYNGAVQPGANFSAGQDWTRLQITYTNNTTASVTVSCCLFTNSVGTAYMDCVQFEQAATASRFNLVENSNFFYSGSPANSWSGTGLATTDTITPTETAVPQLGTHALQITGSPTGAKTVSQTINISGSSGDSFVLAGWAKADSAPISGDRKFGIRVRFNGSNSTDEQYFMEFNPDVDTWQYAAKAVIAPSSYSYIILEISYSYNVNTAYFDGIQLYKEEFGNSYTYDDDGKVISVKDLQAQTTDYQYTGNDLTKIIQDGSAKMTYEYDNYHNVISATTDEDLKYEFKYDDYGNNIEVSTTTAGKTMQSTAAYTSDGNRLTSTTDALGKTTTYSYNADTNVLEWVQYPEDTTATRTNYTYDSMYRMATAACTTDTGLSLNAAYTYEDDLLKSIQTPSTTYNFTYGDFSLRTGVSIGERTLATYHYTEEAVNDRKYDLDRLDYGNGDSVEYEYDDEDRLIKQTYEDGAYISYFYDNDGALAKTYDSQSGITTSYTYDLTGRLVKYVEQSEGHEYSVAYTYNDKNQLAAVMEIVDGHDRESTYEYDEDGRITFFEKVLARRRYNYDAFGRVSSTQTLGRDYAEIFKTTYGYNDTDTVVSGQVTTLTHDGPQYDVTYSYTYDDNGNILSVTEIIPRTQFDNLEDFLPDESFDTTLLPPIQHPVSYVYDSANQLIRENNQAGGFTHTWEYDSAGNILNRKEYAYTTGSLEGVTPTDTVTYTYGDEGWGDLLTAYDGNTITYDGIGNPLSDGTWTYTWQHGRQLASMTDGETTWDYTYDANGLRTERTDGTNTYRYVYDGGKLTFMARNGLYLRFAYTPEGTPLSVLYKGTTYYYVTNLQGDVTAILSQNGYVMVEYTYDAWGNLLTTTGSLANSLGKYNPLRYRGYIYDYETGLYYLQSRYYNPEIGRWISPEPNVFDGEFDKAAGLLGYNVYAYCANNPVIYCDLTGEFLEYTVAVGIVVVYVVAVVLVGVLLFESHRTLKNGSKNRLNDKHTKPRPGRQSEKKKQKNTWKSRK